MMARTDIDRTQFYTRSFCESLAVKVKGWAKNPEGDEELICSVREDDHTPSCRINPRKGTYFDFGRGGSGKETFISELCKERGVDDPFPKNGAGAAPAVPRSQESIQQKAARELWEQATEGEGHPYLHRKKVEANGTRRSKTGVLWKDGALKKMSGDFLLVPAYDSDGSLVGLEQVTPDGKKFALGSKGFHILDDLNPDAPLILAEGFATAASIKELSGANTACCFGAANFESAVRALRKVFPGEIVVAPDAGTDVRIPGVAVVELPSGSEKNDDWNDLHAELGIEDARAFFHTAWDNRKAAEGVAETEDVREVSILDCFEAPSPGTAVRPEKVWVFPRKHLNLVAADPGMGKSLLITKVCCDLSIGSPVLGTNAEPVRKALFLNGECGRDYFNWRFSSSGWRFSKENFTVLHQETLAAKNVYFDIDTPRGRQNLEVALERTAPDLLVIDSLPAFSDEDLNDGQAQNELCKYLKRLAVKHNLALVLITHLRKRRLQDQGTEPTLSEIQGSNAGAKLANVALAVFEKIVEIDGEEQAIKVCKSVKSWGKPVAPFGFCFPELDEDSLQIEMVDVPQSKRLSGSWERVRDGLRHTEFSRQAVESLLEVSDKTAKKLLSNWIEQGKIERVGTGKGTSYIVRGSTVHTLPRIAANPVIATNDTGKSKFPESEPQEENHSGKNTFPEATSVIPRVYKNTGKYIDGASPQSSPNEKCGEVPCNDSGNLVCLLSEDTPSLAEGFEDEPNPFMIDEEDE